MIKNLDLSLSIFCLGFLRNDDAIEKFLDGTHIRVPEVRYFMTLSLKFSGKDTNKSGELNHQRANISR